MKPFFKYSFIVAGCMVCLGLMFGVVGILFGGHTKLIGMLENGELSWGPSQFNCDVSGNHYVFYNDHSDVEWDEANDDGITYNMDEVTDMELKIGGGSLKLIPYDGDKYKVLARNANKYETSVHNGTLIVKSKDDSTNRRDISIYLPKGYQLEDVNIRLGAGAADIEDLRCEKLDIEVGAGGLNADGIQADHVDFNLGAGSAQIDHAEFGESDLSIGLGRLEVNGSVQGDLSVKCDMGSAALDLDGNEEDYNYDINCSAGSVSVGDYDFSGMGSERKMDNGGSYDIRVDCSMGSVIVDF